MERDVESLRKELERLNGMRNNLYTAIGNEERALREKEADRNKMIGQKGQRLQELADKEK